MQDTAGIFLISCNRIRLFPDMMDVSMLIQNAKEGCGMDDRQLLRQLQEQRAGALEAALAQYGAYVLAVIRNRSRGVLTLEDHEEIASDVFLALWRGAKNITRGQLRPWLGAVARKQTAEAMRKKNVYLPLEDDALITLDRLWEQMVEKERCEALAQALAALPEEDREIFYRFYDLSQTTAQIAQALGLNASTVRSRLLRGATVWIIFYSKNCCLACILSTMEVDNTIHSLVTATDVAHCHLTCIVTTACTPKRFKQ